MRDADFRNWLSNIYIQRNGGRLAQNAINSRIGNCSTIERYEGNLDDLFRRDEMHDLLNRLAPATPRHNIPINGDQYTGTATLKTAAKLYQSFCIWDRDNNHTLPIQNIPPVIQSRINQNPANQNNQGDNQVDSDPGKLLQQEQKMAEIKMFVQEQYMNTDEWKKVSSIADKFYSYMNLPDVAEKIASANQPRASSKEIQDILNVKAEELGFKDETRGLFSGYSNWQLRPDYFLSINGETGIIIEVERGKTNINNMDFLDFWKCHICKHAHYLFLFVPIKLLQNNNHNGSNPYRTVINHIETFFDPINYTNVRGTVVFGY